MIGLNTWYEPHRNTGFSCRFSQGPITWWPTVFHRILGPSFLRVCYRWVLEVTSKWHPFLTLRHHNLGSTGEKLAIYQCTERHFFNELTLYSSFPLVHITTGGIMVFLWSWGTSLKCFWKKWRVTLNVRFLCDWKSKKKLRFGIIIIIIIIIT